MIDVLRALELARTALANLRQICGVCGEPLRYTEAGVLLDECGRCERCAREYDAAVTARLKRPLRGHWVVSRLSPNADLFYPWHVEGDNLYTGERFYWNVPDLSGEYDLESAEGDFAWFYQKGDGR